MPAANLRIANPDDRWMLVERMKPTYPSSDDPMSVAKKKLQEYDNK